MSSTFTLPLRLNTRPVIGNDGSVSADNTGAAMISQQSPIVAATVASDVIPAGSIIHSIDAYINVVGAASRSVTLTSNGTTTTIGTLTTTALGKATVAFVASAAVANLLANVGTYDVTISLASEAASAGTMSIQYTGRNSDGTITPYGSGYTNS